MNHDEAVAAGATERYFLDELPDDERDEFEEHYFDCAVCADDVRAGSAVIEALPFVLPPKRVVVPPPVAWRWNHAAKLATAASLIMAAMLGWMQFGVIPPIKRAAEEARQPRVVTYVSLEANRGEGARAPSARQAFVLEVPVPADGSPKYACLIVDAHQITRYSLPVAAAQAQDYVRIEIPAGTLPPGNYTLRVDGRQPRIAEYPFTVD